MDSIGMIYFDINGEGVGRIYQIATEPEAADPGGMGFFVHNFGVGCLFCQNYAIINIIGRNLLIL